MIFDKSETYLPQRTLSRLQGAPARSAGGTRPAIPADARGGAGLRPACRRAGRLRGRRSDRHLCARRRARPAPTSTIVSSDKDLMQLVSDWRRHVRHHEGPPHRPRPRWSEKFGVPPDKVIEVQALAGDSTDNVPGVPGIGVKTAAQLISEYGDLETLLARAGEIKQQKRREALIENAELARISKTARDADRRCGARDAARRSSPCTSPMRCRCIAFLKAMEFTTLTRRVAEFTASTPPRSSRMRRSRPTARRAAAASRRDARGPRAAARASCWRRRRTAVRPRCGKPADSDSGARPTDAAGARRSAHAGRRRKAARSTARAMRRC